MKAVRVVTSILAILVTLEICARADDWLAFRAPLFAPYSVDDLYTVDGASLRGKPFARFKNWQLNSLGLRGPELRPERTRVLCIGASETFGMLETSGKEYPRQLEAALNEQAGGSRFEVVNFSYFGLKLPTANRLLPNLIDDVQPRVAVIYLTYGGYVAPRPKQPVPETLVRPVFELRLAAKINDVARAVLPQPLQNWVKQRWMEHYVRNRPLITRTPADRPQQLAEDLDATVALLRAHGVQPVIVTHANRFTEANDPYREDMLIAWRRFYPLVSTGGLLDMDAQLNEAARRFAAEHGVPLIDAAMLMPGGQKYFTDYTHFTDEGARTFAGILANGIQPLLDGTPEDARSASR